MPDGHVNQMLNVDIYDLSSATTKHWRILETIYLQIIKERIKKKTGEKFLMLRMWDTVMSMDFCLEFFNKGNPLYDPAGWYEPDVLHKQGNPWFTGGVQSSYTLKQAGI